MGSFIPIALSILVIFGILLVLYAFFKFKDSGRSDVNIANINTTLKEIDNTMYELNNFADSVKKDLDDKYQEVLYVYSLIDEKKKALETEKKKSFETEKKKDFEIEVQKEVDVSVETSAQINEKSKKIKYLHAQGHSIANIARILNIGQGEVMLTLSLSKDRSLV